MLRTQVWGQNSTTREPEDSVHAILEFLVRHFEQLWADGKYRIDASQNSTVNGGNAFVVVTSPSLSFRIIRDRLQLTMDLTSPALANQEWVGLEIMYRVVNGAKPQSDLLDEALAQFFVENRHAIADALSTDNWPTTRVLVKEAKAQRANEMWPRG